MSNKRAPFDFATYCKIMQKKVDENKISKEFHAKEADIKKQLGEQIVYELSHSPDTMAILLHSEKAGTLMTSRIIFVASKGVAYKKADISTKPNIFLDTIVPYWYAKELGVDYLSCRDKIFKALDIPICKFLRLETFEVFRKMAPNLKKSEIKRLSAFLNKCHFDFTENDISTVIKN